MTYVNGSLVPRITGGYSTHSDYDPAKCHNLAHAWRCVDCCKREDERDVLECQRCGKQISVACSFDEDFS